MSTRSGRSGSIRSDRSRSRPTYPRKTSTFKSYRPPQQQRRGGLAIQGSRGKHNMLFTDQQMADDLLATVPKLHAAISMDARGSSMWHRKSRKDGVAAYELVPSANGSDDMDLAYASLAKTEIKCHLNEVLNVLISHESSDYQSTMSALCGDKFRDGCVVFQQRCRFSEEARQTLTGPEATPPEGAEGQKVLISVKGKAYFRYKKRWKETQHKIRMVWCTNAKHMYMWQKQMDVGMSCNFKVAVA